MPKHQQDDKPVLYILCEGHSEESVLPTFLQPYWSVRFGDCEVARRYDGKDDLKQNFKEDAHEYLLEPDVFILCLLDLYEAPKEWYNPNQHNRETGFELVQQRLYDQIDPIYHRRFGGFAVVMELETWLLADSKLQQEVFHREYPQPETIHHPAAELKKVYSGYSKLLNASTLFGKASAKRVYDDNCPHFRKLVEWLITDPTEYERMRVKNDHRQRNQKITEQVNALQAKADEAYKRSKVYLEQGLLDEAIEWEEQGKEYDRQINELYSLPHTD
ncbi:MAG: DUF4276 family protein [Phototrophicaceae bacterium]